jgi:hypothetical protein
MEQTKTQLESLLADSDNKVIALSGRWGTGKTHMWDELCKAAQDDVVRKSLSVSLFGAASVADLKLRLVQKAVPYLNEDGLRKDVLTAGWRLAQKAASFVHPALPLSAQLVEFAVPTLLRNKFIVIDDIERKREALSTDEILGFIDDFVQNYGCRFLLILNSDKLTDAASWERYRERVIDEELRLETTPTEAFDIAARTCSPTLRELIRATAETCQLSNIRIIRKVIKTVCKILSEHSQLPEDVLTRLVPSTVLLCATHFRGIDGGPSTEFILSYNSTARFEESIRRERGEEAEDKQRARWILLLEQLNIADVDRYECIVADYLSKGMLDPTTVNEVVGQYARESKLAGSQARSRAFFQATIWQPEVSDAQVVANARELLPDIPLLSCFSVTALANYVREFDGGADVGQEMIDRYVELVHAEAMKPGVNPKDFAVENSFGQTLDPQIKQAFEEARVSTEKPTTLLEVCLRLASSSGWGQEEEAVMNSSTVDSYERTILDTRGQERKLFLLKNAEWLANGHTYRKHFGAAMDNFVEACRRIYVARQETRWPKLLRDVFKDAKVEHLLDEQDSVAAQAARQ